MTIPLGSGTPGESLPSTGGTPRRGLLGAAPPTFSGLLRQTPDVTATADRYRPPQIGPSAQQEPWITDAGYWMQHTPWFQRVLTGLSALSQGMLPEEEAPERIAAKLLAENPGARITHTAFNLGDAGIHSMPLEEGMHANLAGKVQRERGADWWYDNVGKSIDDGGFLVDKKHYVGRDVGMALAQQNGQITEAGLQARPLKYDPTQPHASDVMPKVKPTRPMLGDPLQEATYTRAGGKALPPMPGGTIVEGQLPPAGPNPEAAKVAADYTRTSGIAGRPLPPVDKVDRAAAIRMSDAYHNLVSDSTNPDVQRAYGTFAREVDNQFQAITDAGYKIQFVDHDPYRSSAEMMRDVRDNKTLKVFKTAEDASHPLLTNEQNNKFRAVHGFFGHAVAGNQFGPKGEENAFRSHAGMFSDEARRVMATETRGQNSWYNFGPHASEPVGKRPFAAQKAALFPSHLVGEYGETSSAPERTRKSLLGGR